MSAQCTAACDFLSRATLNQNFGRDERGVQTGYESHEVPVLGRKEMADPPGSGYSALIHSYDIYAKPVLVDLTRQDLVARRAGIPADAGLDAGQAGIRRRDRSLLRRGGRQAEPESRGGGFELAMGKSRAGLVRRDRQLP